MFERLRNGIVLLRVQLWIVPVLMSIGAMALAFVLLEFGPGYFGDADGRGWIFGGDSETARNLLSSLLSGLLTMTSMVVSITFVILTLASNQLGPRIVTSFIADRQIQAVLGVFLGTAMYLIVVLRTLDGTLPNSAQPHVAVTTGTLLTVICLFALLFYVHKIAHAIVADTMIERIWNQLLATLHRLPEHDDDAGAPVDVAFDLPPSRCAVALRELGYVQTIDYDKLVKLAEKLDAILDVTVRAGHFVQNRGEHVRILGDGSAVSDDMQAQIRSAFVIGVERSPAQDLEFSIRQLVEIALRALSPGINDPFTAIAVIDRLGAGLEELIFRRDLPGAVIQDDRGKPRVLRNRSAVKGLIEACLAQIRQAGSEHPAILIHLTDTARRLAPVGDAGEARATLLTEMAAIEEMAHHPRFATMDSSAIAERVGLARIALMSDA